MLSCAAGLMIAAIALDGVTGGELRAEARFDANNVHVGDPMTLTVDFAGDADFAALHPPELSREVDRNVWKVDDASARTETFRDARRLTYRVRPLKQGLLHFPALEFEYTSAVSNAPARVATLAVPVHAKAGTQVALGDFDTARTDLPKPDGIVIDLSRSPWKSYERLDEDGLFAWRKACAKPSAEAFAEFDFPEARLNEAACELLAGNWAKARRIYSVLEWKIGQTPAVERGMVAAAALKSGDADAELPMWRQTLRPVLRFAWAGRLLVFVAAAAALALVLVMLRRAARRLACLGAAVLLAVHCANAADPFGMGGDPFEELNRMHQRMRQEMRQQMQTMTSMVNGMGGGFSMTINGQPAPKVEIKASVRPDRTDIKAGEQFNMILAIEMPKGCSVSLSEIEPSQTVGYTVAGKPENMTDGRAADTNSVVRRVSIPVRYDAPFKGRVTYSIAGMYECRIKTDNGMGGIFSQTFSSNFSVETPPIWMEVKPLAAANQPADYSGAVGTAFKLTQKADRYKVETNDVVRIDLTLEYVGFVPPDAMPGAAMRMRTQTGGRITASRYFIADGTAKTPDVEFSYYDVSAKSYRRVIARGQPLMYSAETDGEAETVVVNAENGEDGGALVKLRFAPAESAPEIATIDSAAARPATTEEHGEWVRVDDGKHAGWARKDELK